MSAGRTPTVADRLGALTDAFIYRPGFDGLTFEQSERLIARAEARALFGLLGALQAEIGPPSDRALSRTALVEIVERILTGAAAHERERAAQLGGTPQPVYVHARPEDDAPSLCGGGGPQAQTGERDAVTCPQCAVLLVGRDAVNGGAS